MEIYYTRPTEPYIDRDSVAKCSSVPTLREWREALGLVADDVEANIQALRFAGEPVRAAAAKLGFLRSGQAWITRRLRELSADSAGDDLLIERLRTEITRLQARIVELGTVRDVKLLALVVHAAGDYVVVNERHAEALPSLALTRTEDPETGGVTFTTEVTNG